MRETRECKDGRSRTSGGERFASLRPLHPGGDDFRPRSIRRDGLHVDLLERSSGTFTRADDELVPLAVVDCWAAAGRTNTRETAEGEETVPRTTTFELLARNTALERRTTGGAVAMRAR